MIRTMRPQWPRRTPPGRGAGFTLVELLVVITIIVLLATLLIPTIITIVNQVYVARSAFAVRRLHDGVMTYKDRTGFLPGEMKDPNGTVPRDKMDNRLLTGSQVLAACLFNIEYNELGSPVDEDDIDASKTYATYKKEYLISYDVSLTSAPKLKHNTLSDGFPPGRALPICYFLASNLLVDRNKTSQFKYIHNKEYIDAANGNQTTTQTTLQNWLTERSPSSNSVLNDGQFILIAPGLNRKYLVNEVPNPANPANMILEVDSDDLANDYGARNSQQ